MNVRLASFLGKTAHRGGWATRRNVLWGQRQNALWTEVVKVNISPILHLYILQSHFCLEIGSLKGAIIFIYVQTLRH